MSKCSHRGTSGTARCSSSRCIICVWVWICMWLHSTSWQATQRMLTFTTCLAADLSCLPICCHRTSYNYSQLSAGIIWTKLVLLTLVLHCSILMSAFMHSAWITIAAPTHSVIQSHVSSDFFRHVSC
jgi:hypothetical protein